MATKLYPPIIEGTIPAFSGTVITVPFSLNRAVAIREIAGIKMKIKTVQGTVIETLSATSYDLSDYTAKFTISPDKYNIGQYYKIQLAFVSTGNTLGYYSTVGVIKYTSKPTVSINGLSTSKLNSHVHSYVVTYSQENGDPTEKMYSMRLKIVKTDDGEVIVDSGDILHNINNDDSAYESTEVYKVAQDVEDGISYYIQATIITTNNLTISTPKYKIVKQKSSIDNTISKYCNLVAENDFDDGFITVSLEKKDDPAQGEISGNYIVGRNASNEKDVWRELFSMSVSKTTEFNQTLFVDKTVEHGITYTYSIQQVNVSGIYSEKMLSEPVKADFEDMFLYDGERQLKVRFNPKVSSFKIDVLEQKVDTIRSKYPFIFRNGTVYYREFPISGLISYQMDENEYFISKEEILFEENRLHRHQTPSEDEKYNIIGTETDLLTKNITTERIFKMKVLEWLNDGNPKLFRSPAEGNFMVRLLNTSLQPNDTLGRMIHTFSSTAYEISEPDFEQLLSYGIINTEEKETGGKHTGEAKTEKIVVIDFDKTLYDKLHYGDEGLKNDLAEGKPIELTSAEKQRLITSQEDGMDIESCFIAGTNILDPSMDEGLINDLLEVSSQITIASDGILNSHPIHSISVTNASPGTTIILGNEEIVIGVTGNYYASFEEDCDTLKVILPDNGTLQYPCEIEYEYYPVNDGTTGDKTIDMAEFINQEDVICRQFIGTDNLLNDINTTKVELIKFYWARARVRNPIKEIFYNQDTEKYYYDRDCSQLATEPFDGYSLYAVCRPLNQNRAYKEVQNEIYYVDANYSHGAYIDDDGNEIDVFPAEIDGRYGLYYDAYTGSWIEPDKRAGMFTLTIDGTNIDLISLENLNKYIGVYDFSDAQLQSKNISCGIGIIIDAGYNINKTTYTVENTYENTPILEASMKAYDVAVQKLEDFRNSSDNTEDEDTLIKNINKAEKTYLRALSNLVEED